LGKFHGFDPKGAIFFTYYVYISIDHLRGLLHFDNERGGGGNEVYSKRQDVGATFKHFYNQQLWRGGVRIFDPGHPFP
jgi:hypothetical protein